jgi:hypothetical protein
LHGDIGIQGERTMRNMLYLAGIVLASAGLFCGTALAAPPASVPEPTTLALLAGGIGIVAAVRMRRRK